MIYIWASEKRERFWKIEEVDSNNILHEDEVCMEKYTANTKMNDS